MHQMKTFIVIPVYNEQSHIRSVLLSCQNEGFDNIIVVDDGSEDNTYLEASVPGVTVLRHFINRGVGAATQTGIDAAKILGAEIVITMDGDGQHDGEDVHSLISSLHHYRADIVIGTRFMKDTNRIPFTRRFFNIFANLVTFVLSGIYLSDSQSGFRAFSRQALKRIYITANGYEFSSEIIRETKYYKMKIVEIPISVHYTPYTMSKGQNLSTGIVTIFKLIIRSLMR